MSIRLKITEPVLKTIEQAVLSFETQMEPVQKSIERVESYWNTPAGKSILESIERVESYWNTPAGKSILENITQTLSYLNTPERLSLPILEEVSLVRENDSLKNQVDVLEGELKTCKTKEHDYIQKIKRLETQLNRYKKSMPAHLDPTLAWVENAPPHK